LIVLGFASDGSRASAGAAPDSLATRCEYGVTLALRGEWASAEKVFISLLSRAPSDPRALTNLGNLHLLRGDLEMALVFYERAVRADSADGGIRLNRSVAYMLAGDQERAVDEAAEGARRTGGEEASAALLGIRLEAGTGREEKGASKPRMTQEEVRALLSTAAKAVPKDSATVTSNPASGKTESKKSPLVLRSAGARSAGEAEGTMLLYWKR